MSVKQTLILVLYKYCNSKVDWTVIFFLNCSGSKILLEDFFALLHFARAKLLMKTHFTRKIIRQKHSRFLTLCKFWTREREKIYKYTGFRNSYEDFWVRRGNLESIPSLNGQYRLSHTKNWTRPQLKNEIFQWKKYLCPNSTGSFLNCEVSKPHVTSTLHFDKMSFR